MATRTEPAAPRVPLSRDRVLAAAIELADEGGIQAVTMRRLAQQLGVEAMSLYYHVANKEEVLDGMIDAVMIELNAAVAGVDTDSDWKSELRGRILTAREVLLRHKWAPGVLESRINMSPSVMQYFDSIGSRFTAAGFSMDLTHHAMHALGSRALGFTQELFDAGDEEGPSDPDADAAMIEQMAGQFPFLAEMARQASHDADSTLGWCDDQFEFEFGLGLILDGLDSKLQDN
jgi:AcrR family transcriptional regulator